MLPRYFFLLFRFTRLLFANFHLIISLAFAYSPVGSFISVCLSIAPFTFSIFFSGGPAALLQYNSRSLACVRAFVFLCVSARFFSLSLSIIITPHEHKALYTLLMCLPVKGSRGLNANEMNTFYRLFYPYAYFLRGYLLFVRFMCFVIVVVSRSLICLA